MHLWKNVKLSTYKKGLSSDIWSIEENIKDNIKNINSVLIVT